MRPPKALLPLALASFLAACGDRPASGGEQRSPSDDPAQAEEYFHNGRRLVFESQIKVGYNTSDYSLLDRGIAELERAARVRPDDADYQYWAGRALGLRHAHERALAYLTRATELNPAFGAAYHELGALKLEDGEVAAARVALERAFDISPEDPQLLYDLGQLEEADARLEIARGYYERSIQLRQAEAKAHFRLSEVLRRLGDDAGAERELAEFKRWNELHEQLEAARAESTKRPDDVDALARLGVLLFRVQRFQQAKTVLGRATAADDGHGLAWYFLGMTLHELRELDAARDALEKASQAVPDEPRPLIELAWVHAKRGDPDAAEQALGRYLALAGEQAEGQFEVGLFRREAGDLDAAVAAFRKAIELDGGYVEARLALAEIHYGRDELAEAAEQYRRVLEVAPDHAGARHSLEVVTRGADR